MSRQRSQIGKRFQVRSETVDAIVMTGPNRGSWRTLNVWTVTDTQEHRDVSQYRTYADAQWEADHREAGTWKPGLNRRRTFTFTEDTTP